MNNPSNSHLYRRLQQRLDTLSKAHRFRTLNKVLNPSLVNCGGNSYLNLENEPLIHQRAQELCHSLSGNGASRLVQEVSPLYNDLEIAIAQWKHSERALVFNSGYIANVSMIQALGSSKTTFFSDRLNHASIVDGIRLSAAHLTRYNHCDMAQLEQQLRTSTSPEKIVVTDSVFSMDGTVAPLKEIVALCQRYGALCYVDEAHGTGVFGPTGGGLVEELGLQEHVAIRMGTFSKAIGGVGGYVACNQLLYDFFVNSCRGLIYSTALAPINIAWNIAAIEFITAHHTRGKKLLQSAHHALARLAEKGIETGESSSQIIPIVTQSEERALSLSQHLLSKGFSAPAIRPPTVPVGESRVRLSLHSGITPPQLSALIHTVVEWFNA